MTDFVFGGSSDVEEETEFSRPRWFEPPDDVLGVVVPCEMFVARTPNVVIALTHVRAYPEGCVLATHVAGRMGDLEEDDWHDILDVAFHGGRSRYYRHRGGKPSDTVRRYGVRFADGRTATTLDRIPPPPSGATDHVPTGPILTERSGGGGSSRTFFDHREELWLWPLPPAERFEIIVEWPIGRVPVTIAELDGAVINEAASRARPYWPMS
jgi:hypothetical protein